MPDERPLLDGQSVSGTDAPLPVAVWRCPRCGYDRVEYPGDRATPETWLCEDPCCKGPAWSVTPASERQLERIPVVAVAKIEHATDLAERYGEAIVKIGAALVAEDLNPRGRIMRARGVIAGLGESDACRCGHSTTSPTPAHCPSPENHA
jgi:hypothetical protein